MLSSVYNIPGLHKTTCITYPTMLSCSFAFRTTHFLYFALHVLFFSLHNDRYQLELRVAGHYRLDAGKCVVSYHGVGYHEVGATCTM